MEIKSDVRAAARHFGLDPAMIQAVDIAEGNLLRAVQCTFPHVTTREEALDITCRSAVHAMSDYLKINAPGGFINYWGHRWAPVGVDNDPHNLNKNWPINVGKNWPGQQA
jgi:hypothetical protein